MSQADDPYVYPGTSVLRNKLNIHDAGRLGRAEDDLAGVRYAALLADLPKAPFTFDTLKDIHRTLFQDVYQWAGQPRSMAMGKPETDSPLSRVTWFTRPDRIEAEGKAVFDRLEQAKFLTGLDRPNFAAAAAELLRSVNDLHSFRVMLNCKRSREFGHDGSFRPRNGRCQARLHPPAIMHIDTGNMQQAHHRLI